MADEFAATGGATSTTALAAQTSGDGNDPSVPSPAYVVEKTRRDLVRMLWDGTEAVRAAGTDVLPQYENEPDDVYETRKSLSAVHSALQEVVDVSVGLLMTQPPTVDADAHPKIREFWENVDARGNAGPVFCTALSTDGLLDGKVGIFTDMARVTEKIDAATAARRGLRPWWIAVTADDQYMELYDTVDGVERLVLFIRRQIAQERLGSFGLKTVYRYHVYEHIGTTITARTYEADTLDARPMLDEASVTTLTNQEEIPWAPLVGGRVLSDGTISPPFLELAYQVIEHHMIKTGRLSLATLAFAPTMVVVNAPLNADGSNPAVETGPRQVIHARFAPGESIPAKPVYYTSPDVSVMEPAKDMLENVEASMTVAGRGFLAPDKRGAETAKSKQLSDRAGNASLSRFAGRLQDCLERATGHAARYMGVPVEQAGSITVSRRFEEALMEPNVMLAYGKLLELGMPVRLAFQALKLQGRIPPDADEDEYVLEWEVGLMSKREAQRVDQIPVDDEAPMPDEPDPPPAPRRTFRIQRDADGRATALAEDS